MAGFVSRDAEHPGLWVVEAPDGRLMGRHLHLDETAAFLTAAGVGDDVSALVTESDDRRRLGINLRGLTIDDGVAAPLKVRLDDARLGAGFHPVQGKAEAPYRWTRGKALLPASLWADCAGPVTLRLELGGERLLRWCAPDEQMDGVELAERRRA